MASKKIKGITIEIDGNTTKLSESLKGVERTINSTNSELRDLNKALKLDPKNTELLSQKQELLRKNIQESTNKLNQLKEAQKQMGNYNNLTEEQKENYRALSIEIAKSENAVKNMNSELKKSSSIDLSKVGTTLKKVGSIATDVAKKVAGVVTAVSGVLAGVVAAGVKSYADLEQNIGGVETLFGEHAQKVIDNANKAYKTAGVSANEYMAGVTSFSASLLQSLGGDTAKAADIADMAFQDMSDNANKFGTDMGSIQNAYQGFAKQNYTMLDNLKLGYGGTKTEMERLLADAQKFSGIKYDINNLSDVYSAIHVIQKEMKVTGTTAKEAASTISGSANAMKASFDNFLNGSGSPEELGESITTFISNIIMTITELAPQILTGLTTLLETLMPQLGVMLIEFLPQLFTSVQTMLTSLLSMISNNVKPIAEMVVKILTSLVNFFLDNLPMLIETGIELMLALIQGLAESIPELIPKIIEAILTIITTIIDHLDEIIMAGIDILLALIQGIIDAIPMLLEKIPEIIVKLVLALTDPEMLMKLVMAAIELIKSLAIGLVKAIPELIMAVPKIITGLFKGLKDVIFETDWLQLGKDVLKGILDGIVNFGDSVKKAAKKLFKEIKNNIKEFFGIKSPSRVMRDEVGKFLVDGIGVGIKEEIPSLITDTENAMKELNNGIQASVNPTINPTANSNPLILNIENFNNTRNQDVEQLAEELEFYRKNSALAKGSV